MSSTSFQTPTPPTAETSAEDRGQAFRAVEGGNEMSSGETLLVGAYMAIWAIVLLFVVLSWRRQSRIDRRVESLEAALEKARREDAAAE